MIAIRFVAIFVLSCAIAASSITDCSAQVVRKITGSFTTPTQQGTFTFTTVKAVRVGNMTALQGNFSIAGKTYPGSVLPTASGLSMVWYYGVSGNSAGQAFVTPQTLPVYSGNITFTTRAGVITSQGTLTVSTQ